MEENNVEKDFRHNNDVPHVHVQHAYILSCLFSKVTFCVIDVDILAKREVFGLPVFYFIKRSDIKVIELKSLSKSFGSGEETVNAITDIDLTIEDGDIFGIIGLSGAGKSTLIRCINYLEKPTSGRVIFDGVDLGSLKTRELLKIRQSMSMIFQSFNLLSQRTVLKNVLFPLEIAGLDKEKANKKALELLKIVGLENKISAYPSQLSGGQKQRVAIARALATDPKVLLCDEATSALDPNTTASILELLKEINRTMGVTIIVITHEMDVIDSICNKVAVLANSRICEVGKVTEVFTNPQSEAAKELVLPKSMKAIKNSSGYCLRLVFNGESSKKPVVSSLVKECGTNLSILFADMKDIDGKSYGQMIINIPENTDELGRVEEWLRENNIQYTLEG